MKQNQNYVNVTVSECKDMISIPKNHCPNPKTKLDGYASPNHAIVHVFYIIRKQSSM